MGKRILVVEDNEECRQLYAKCLHLLGHEPVLAESGTEGLDLLLSDGVESIDLVIVDKYLSLPAQNCQSGNEEHLFVKDIYNGEPITSGYQLIKIMDKCIQEGIMPEIPTIFASGELSGENNYCSLDNELKGIRFVKRVSGKMLTRHELDEGLNYVFNEKHTDKRKNVKHLVHS